MKHTTNWRVRGWVVGLTAVVLAGLSVYFTVDTAKTIGRMRSEHDGTVTVAHCVFTTFSQRRSVYECEGEFVARDGDLRVRGVTFTRVGALDPGAHVDAMVSGPDDHPATIDATGSVVWGLLLAGGCAAGLIALIIWVWRRLRAG
jgi:hypothetical protein